MTQEARKLTQIDDTGEKDTASKVQEIAQSSRRNISARDHSLPKFHAKDCFGIDPTSVLMLEDMIYPEPDRISWSF